MSLTLYIIHAEKFDGSVWHYIGVTGQDDPRERFEQHLRNTTRKAWSENLKFARRICFWQLIRHASIPQEEALNMLDEATVRQFICPTCKPDNAHVQTEKGHPFFTDDPLLLRQITRKEHSPKPT
jgi:predicted GIY-YIG superfamily endonuclease